MHNIVKKVISIYPLSLSIRIANIILFFLIQVFAAKVLSIEDFGKFTYALNVIQVVALFFTFGFHVSSLKYCRNYLEQKNYSLMCGFINLAMVAPLILCIFSLIFYTISTFFISFNEIIHDTSYYIIIISYFFASSQILQFILKADFKLITSQIYEQLCVPFILLLLMYLLSLLNIEGYSLYINLYGVLYIGLVILLLSLVIKKIYSKFLVAKEKKVYSIKLWIKSSVGIGIGLFLSLLVSRLDILLLGFYGNTSEIGGYSLALRFSALIIIPGTSIAHILGPHIINVAIDRQRVGKFFFLSSATTILINISCLLIFYFIKDFIFEFMGKDYISYSTLFVILSIGQVFNLTNGIYFTFCCAQGKQALLARFLLLDIIIMIGTYYIVYNQYGLTGVAISNVICTILLNVAVGKLILTPPYNRQSVPIG